MVNQIVRIQNPMGLHLRPASVLCNEAIKYHSTIKIVYQNAVADAKSILSVLGICVKSNSEIEICCEGPDENEALRQMVTVINNGLGE